MLSAAALLAQSDQHYAHSWAHLLEASGLECHIVASVAAARRALCQRADWKIAVFDERLSDGSGVQLLEYCKGRTDPRAQPTVLSMVEDAKLSVVLDAYLHAAVPVPRSWVSSVLSRIVGHEQQQGSQQANSTIVFDPRTRTLEAGGRKAVLSTGEWQLLTYLLKSGERWCSASEIASHQFGRLDDRGRTLVWKYVSQARKRLPSLPHFLEHRGGCGYRLHPEFRRRFEVVS